MDLFGIGLFTTMLVSLLLFLMRPEIGSLYLLAVTAVAGFGFTVRENRVVDPFIDLRVLRGNLPLLATYGRMLLTAVVSYAFLYGFTQWLEDGRGLKPAVAGLVLLPMFAIAIVVSVITGRRKEVRGKLIVGACTQIVACGLLLLLGGHSGIWLLIGVTVIVGIPQGLNNLANQNAMYRQAEPARMGSSAGLLRTFGYLGAITAAAANGVFFPRTADTGGLHHLAEFLLVVTVSLLVMTLLDRSLRASKTTETRCTATERNT